MAPRSPIGAARRFKDPNKLTPYEERLWALAQKGMSYKEIAKELGLKNVPGVNSRVLLIREKLGLNHG